MVMWNRSSSFRSKKNHYSFFHYSFFHIFATEPSVTICKLNALPCLLVLYRVTTKEYDPENPYLTHVGEHQEVKLLWGNELGIHDMSGNVGEWCSDFYAPYTSSPQVNPKGENPYYGNVRVYRGGSFEYAPFHCRITCRFYSNEDWYKENGYPEYSFNNLGLRLALPQNYK